MARTVTRPPDEVDGAKNPPMAMAAAIAVTIMETILSQNIYLKE